MLHACFYTICLVFRYTSWRFYAISGTNLLTRSHSASSLFSSCFCVSEKLHRKYSRNWTKQVRKLLIFPDGGRGPKGSRRGARGWPHHEGVRPRPWLRPPAVRSPWSTPDDAPFPIRSLPTENPKTIGKIFRTVPQLRRRCRRISGTEVYVLAPCRDGEVPPEPSPSVSIVVSAISIDLTAISINLAVSYDEEGVVLPRC
jgi:hypothetical protein